MKKKKNTCKPDHYRDPAGGDRLYLDDPLYLDAADFFKKRQRDLYGCAEISSYSAVFRPLYVYLYEAGELLCVFQKFGSGFFLERIV